MKLINNGTMLGEKPADKKGQPAFWRHWKAACCSSAGSPWPGCQIWTADERWQVLWGSGLDRAYDASETQKTFCLWLVVPLSLTAEVLPPNGGRWQCDTWEALGWWGMHCNQLQSKWLIISFLLLWRENAQIGWPYLYRTLTLIVFPGTMWRFPPFGLINEL